MSDRRSAPTLQSLSRVMRFGRFRLGRFFSWFLLRLGPISVKHAGLIDALVSVRAKEIALRLKEVCRKPSGAITVEVRQRRRKRRRSYAMFDRCRNDETPFGLRLPDGPREIPIKQKIVQRGVALICFHDSVQKFRANDAAAAPDGGNVAQVEVPLVFGASRAQKLHSLRVRYNFRRVKGIEHCID